jgi:hypothetical protein
MSTGDWLVAVGAALTAIGALATLITDLKRNKDSTELQESFLREAQKEWTKGDKKGAEPKAEAAAKKAKKALESQRRKRLILPIAFTLLAVVAIIAGLIVG